MNCASRVMKHIEDAPERMALWTEKTGEMNFGEIGELVSRAQSYFKSFGLAPGDAVLVLDLPGPNLYASIMAILASGAHVLFVEPWLPAADIESIIQLVKPRLFIGPLLAQAWALKVRGIRKIERWVNIKKISQGPAGPIHFEDLPREARAIITFTSGTTGKPKGVVRTHGYMWDMHNILTENDTRDKFQGPDLAVFPNIALLHLGTGRGAIIVPSQWKKKSLSKIAAFPEHLRPESVSCGPAFLKTLLTIPGFEELKSFHIGGALTDCWILEESFARWTQASFIHIYGGTEAEPVALSDARQAVKRSKEKNYFQTLFVGSPLPILTAKFESDGIWVSGSNVCPEYLGSPEENRVVKKRDAQGVLWHMMGDRIVEKDGGWWYAGRSSQKKEDFDLEQRIYMELQSSANFVHGDKDGKLVLCGENLRARENLIREKFPQITRIKELKIVRDRRHRARIDRVKSIRKGAPDL